MSNLFFDTSALAKRYMSETGSVAVRQQTASTENNIIFIAQITPVELYSAIARQYHDGAVTLPQLQAFRHLLTHHVATQYRVISLLNPIINTAQDLQEMHRLRAYDAIQLATALQLQIRLKTIEQTLTFVASDTRLLQSAEDSGLSVQNPNEDS